MSLTDAAHSESRSARAPVGAPLVRALLLRVASTVLSAGALTGTVGKTVRSGKREWYRIFHSKKKKIGTL